MDYGEVVCQFRAGEDGLIHQLIPSQKGTGAKRPKSKPIGTIQ